MRIQPSFYSLKSLGYPSDATSDPWEWPAALPGGVYIPSYDEEYKVKELLKCMTK